MPGRDGGDVAVGVLAVSPHAAELSCAIRFDFLGDLC